MSRQQDGYEGRNERHDDWASPVQGEAWFAGLVRSSLGALGVSTGLWLTLPEAGWARERIPGFARKYEMSCNACHQPIPKPTAFGEMFARNGFRLLAGEEPRGMIDTGDDLLAP